MLRVLILCAILFSLAAAAAQEQPLRAAAASAADFAPRGWTVETQARGDLDGDGLVDLALVLLGPDPPGAQANRRMFGIALARPEGGYRLAEVSRRFLPPKRASNGLSQGWMLFEDGSVEVDRGRLRVSFEYTRGHNTFTFRWKAGALRLIGHDVVSVEAGCLHQLSVNFLTGRAKMVAGQVDRDKERVRWKDIGRQPLPPLAAIGDGEEFDPHRLWLRFPLRCPDPELG